ncbi:aminotransferase family protein [Bradyrhizobium sp. CCBAU 51745]|uniref:aminotransferase family protein n=1 Tax=Bradyrhizobium sp. CCBAU 51745 TaxID=1325099 RepID=UPI002305B8FB|nr:aspartate aminotransferase family protein [Bradyrhizobium sp. CCBAU 51745]
MTKMKMQTASPCSSQGSIRRFYAPSDAVRLPTVARAEGVYMWDAAGRRYIDASSGPVVSNIGHGNHRVINAMYEQAKKVTYAHRTVFENEPNILLGDLVTKLAGPGLERAYFVSGGSEATETAIKLARQYAVVRGDAERWKVISLDPGYHGATLGAFAVSGDPQTQTVFGALAKGMPKAPAPFRYRLPPNHDSDGYARYCAAALEELIVREGPQTVLAFMMEPVGGLATGALVAHDEYYRTVREICSRHGVLLIYDEVMSGAGRTGTFLAAHHWPDAKPDLVTLAKGIGAGYTPLGAVLAPSAMVDTVVGAGGFLHSYTYAANPLSCAVGLAVVSELIDHNLMANAGAMGLRMRQRLEELQATSGIIGDIRGNGLLMAIEIVANKETKEMLPAARQAVYRIVELGIERGLLLYSRRTANGKFGEWLMISPPLTVTNEEVDEIARLIGETLAAYEKELAS